MKFDDVCFNGKCDVCEKETKVAVLASSMGCASWAYCFDCLNDGLEPYGAMVAYISGAGRFPDDISEPYQQLCKHILNKLGIPEERFIKDVDKAAQEYVDYYNSVYNLIKENK